MAHIFIDTYNARGDKYTDLAVADAINIYINKDISTLTDGLINRIPVISAEVRNTIAKPYNIDKEAWNTIKKAKDFRYMDRSASDLKLGLIISWCRVRQPIYLTFLYILVYSSLIKKYFQRDFDKSIMKYTIDNADNRTDFKKYNGSLLLVCTKKVETFIKRFDKTYPKYPSDWDVYQIWLATYTRINEMIKAISQKYYKNFHDPNIKTKIQYETDSDGKVIVDESSQIEMVRRKAIDNLAYPSEAILKSIGLGVTNPQNLKYRMLFINSITDVFQDTSSATNALIDAWRYRMRNDKVTIELMRKNFITTMIKAREVKELQKASDNIIKYMLKDMDPQDARKINKYDLFKYIRLYLIYNIYFTAMSVN